MKGKKKSHHYKITFYYILLTNFDNSEILHKTAPITKYVQPLPHKSATSFAIRKSQANNLTASSLYLSNKLHK